MPLGEFRFTKFEVEKALRAIKAAGSDRALRIEPDGVMRIVPRSAIKGDYELSNVYAEELQLPDDFSL